MFQATSQGIEIGCTYQDGLRAYSRLKLPYVIATSPKQSVDSENHHDSRKYCVAHYCAASFAFSCRSHHNGVRFCLIDCLVPLPKEFIHPIFSLQLDGG